MRVAHIVFNMQIGGLETVVMNLMRAQQSGIDVEPMLVCVGRGGPLVADVKVANIPVEVLGHDKGFRPAIIFRLAKILRRDCVEVVHCHNFSGMVYGSLAARLAGVSGVIYTAHGARTAADRRQMTFKRLGLVHRWITVSEHARRVAIEQAGGSAQSVQAVINGVDLSLYESNGNRSRVRAELSISEDEFVFGIVARLSDAKDHIGLIDAFGRGFTGREDVSLLIVGDGELEETIRRAANESRAKIRMVGTRQDIPDVLSAMDAFVLSSHTEGLAITLLEASAARLPIIATDAGGNTEVVLDGETGKVVPVRDPVALSAAMSWVERHRAEAAGMGAAGRERVKANFSIESMARRYREIYCDAMGPR